VTTKEACLGAWLAASFAAWLAAHVALAVGLGRQQSWWRGAAALVVPPLAPGWGWGAGMQKRAYTWALALAAYALGVFAAR
jgi:hypothetical protein